MRGSIGCLPHRKFGIFGIAELPDSVKAKSKEAVAVTDQYVRNNPWNAVGIAAGVGFFLGLAFSAGTFLRRRD